MSDFNSKVGSGKVVTSIGEFGLGTVNKNGETLIDSVTKII